jgi:hypothetical protein
MTSGTHDHRVVVLGGVLIAVLSAGWFLLSWQVAHNPAGDAFGEALGMVFFLLIVGSVIGGMHRRGQAADDRDFDG